MFVDFLSMLLVNMATGYLLLAAFVLWALDSTEHRNWAPGFGMVGVMALVFGGVIVTTWPLPGPYNSLFGEFSCFFGIIFLGAAWAMARGWSLSSVALYAFLPGIAAMIAGGSIIYWELTAKPLLSGVGFILSGAAGAFAGVTYRFLRKHRLFRVGAAGVLLMTSAIWLLNGWPEYFLHMGPNAFQKWVPMTMRTPPPPK